MRGSKLATVTLAVFAAVLLTGIPAYADDKDLAQTWVKKHTFTASNTNSARTKMRVYEFWAMEQCVVKVWEPKSTKVHLHADCSPDPARPLNTGIELKEFKGSRHEGAKTALEVYEWRENKKCAVIMTQGPYSSRKVKLYADCVLDPNIYPKPGKVKVTFSVETLTSTIEDPMNQVQ
ncbi:MAG: hypothetical protein H0T78_05360 [Longispora sp.]|nr:hypothetical protein [Longispora sp. (in: high G+C Gram-positive bacteria)]